MKEPIRKITFVLFSLRPGGAERAAVRLANELQKEMDVSVVQLCNSEPFYDLLPKVRLYKYFGANQGILRYPNLALHLRKCFQLEKPDIVVVFGETISPFVLFIGKVLGQKVIVSNRASPVVSLRGRMRNINPLIFPLAAAVMVQTNRAAKMLSRRYRLSRFIVVENPVFVPSTIPPYSSRENICVTIGYLGGHKNQKDLLLAFANANPSDWEFWIVGDGPDKEELEELAKHLGIEDRVKFLGLRSDVYGILQSARIFLFSSKTEGFPNALAEAMACGCACISYDCVTGPAEMIQHGRSGILVEVGDVATFSKELVRVISTESLCKTLGEKAHSEIRRFETKAVSARMVAAIQKVV